MLGNIINTVSFGVYTIDPEGTLDLQQKMNLQNIATEFHGVFGNLYRSAVSDINLTQVRAWHPSGPACGILLWISRGISADTVVRWLRAAGRVLPFAAQAEILLSDAIAITHKTLGKEATTTLHRVFLVILESSQMLRSAGLVWDLFRTLESLFRCLGSFFWSQIAQIVGRAAPNAMQDPGPCCSEGLGEVVKYVLSRKKDLNDQMPKAINLTDVARRVGSLLR